jgi:uncharacterized membrane protein
MTRTLASISLGPLQFDSPMWLVALVPASALVLVFAARSLSGLGPVTRRVAIGVRLIVVALIVAALGEPQWRREARDVSLVVVLDTSESVPRERLAEVEAMIREAIAKKARDSDRLGVVTTAREAYVQSLPSALTQGIERHHLGAVDGTDLGAGIRLALAVKGVDPDGKPTETGKRILLVSDGNQTGGNVLQAAEAARALKVPVDVLPLRYRYDSEVIVDRLVAPASAREGETINLRAVIEARAPARGRLTIMMNDEVVDLDPDSPSLGARVELRQGTNVIAVPVKALVSGPQRFKAVFEPEVRQGQPVGDTLAENNQSLAVTFVTGEGRVLVVTEDTSAASHFLDALESARIRTRVVNAEGVPESLTELNAYDAIVIFNEAAYGFTQKFQEDLRQYVHDAGGGLIMIGGPDAYGAGGWIGSPLEDALPVRLDPPQKRQMPRGALVLVIHSIEAPDGVYLGKKVSEAALNALSRLDYIGINEFRLNGTEWVLPLTKVGDGSRARRAINSLTFGDMPDFAPSLELSLKALRECDAGQKHVIMISDGDPSTPPTSLLQQFVDAGITISTVGVYPHSGGDTSRMQFISQYTGGRHYHINTQQALARVPQIFIKEAQTVRRSLIWEGTPFTPTMIMGSEPLRGLGTVPPISGYVVTAEREGLSLMTLKGHEGDPILAQWQYGLGKVVAYTSDATTKWNAAWVAWLGYRQFWEQHLRWVMRPGGSANVRVTTENRADHTLIVVEALDAAGERLNFATFRGRVATPDGKGIDVDLRQVGPGRYQGTVATADPGTYVVSLRYAAPDAAQADGVIEGSVQAAITRPYADEYRTLEDNAALLRQVADLTGGRVLRGDPGTEDLWAREGLEMPVSLRPAWLWAAIAGISLFLLDVGVRRVRVDVVAIANAVRRAAGRAADRKTEHVDTLRLAREQARAKMARRAGADAGQMASEAARVAGTKFEADAGALHRAATLPAPGEAPAPIDRSRPSRPVPDAKEGEQGMSRLLKAKRRAREDMTDETGTKE